MDDAGPSRAPFVLPGAVTRGAALALMRQALARAGIGEAGLDARLLLGEALAIGASELAARPDVLLDPAERDRLAEFVARRLSGEPVGRIRGEREFWSLRFRLGPDTLEPRPDSETLVAAALACASDRPVGSVLDLGTGTGCLLVALLTEWPGAWGIGIDRSPGALAVARGNAVLNGIGARAGFAGADWTACLSPAARFDAIVSNPPYIAADAIPRLAVEVRDHDPLVALNGGADGLDAYRRILPACALLLAPSGFAVLEIGEGQAEAVAAIGREAGLAPVRATADLAGVTRALCFARAPDGAAKKALVETREIGL